MEPHERSMAAILFALPETDAAATRDGKGNSGQRHILVNIDGRECHPERCRWRANPYLDAMQGTRTFERIQKF